MWLYDKVIWIKTLSSQTIGDLGLAYQLSDEDITIKKNTNLSNAMPCYLFLLALLKQPFHPLHGIPMKLLAELSFWLPTPKAMGQSWV